MMRLFYGLLIFVCAGQYVCGVDNNANVNSNNKNDKTANKSNNDPNKPMYICETCKCNAKEAYMDCRGLSLFRLFDAKEWETVKPSELAGIKRIDFDKNGLEVVTRFPNLTEIQYLSFSSNKISQIKHLAFFNLTALVYLDLSDNKLTNQALQKEVFEGHFDASEYEPMKNLKWLNLINNELHALNPDVFDHLDNLETLLLGRNQFKIIDPNTADAISSLNKLKVLDLSFMELRTIPEHMLHAPHSLHTLNLTGNLFTVLPEALNFAPNLVNLNLNDNPFVHLGGEHSFPLLPKLETLNLSYSRTLETIDEGAFFKLSALQHFACRNNAHLKSIHPNAFAKSDNSSQTQWPPIRSIILYSNNLTVLGEHMLEHWHEIEEIDIRNNPWKCACENQWMVHSLIPIIKEKSKNNPTMYEDLKCSSPAEMESQTLVELSAKGVHMRCVDTYGHRPERDGPILVGVFIGLMIGIPITLAAIYIYRRGCFGVLGYRPSPADYGRAFYKRTELQEDLHI